VSLVQCLAKNYKNDSIASVVRVCCSLYGNYTVKYTHAQRVRICCHNTDLFHAKGHDRIISVIFGQAMSKAN